jgi:peptide/nickel transport system substrate-binding protein
MLKKFVFILLSVLFVAGLNTGCAQNPATVAPPVNTLVAPPVNTLVAPPVSSVVATPVSTGVATSVIPGVAPTGTKMKDTLIIGSSADINSLDLLTQNDQINNIVLKLTHETLLFDSNKGVLSGELAESWNYTNDTTLVIKLKQNVKFSDGSPMTADDVKFTYDMCLKSNDSSSLAGLKSVDVIDPYTVQLNLDSYDNEFIINLTAINVGIQSKKAYDSGMDKPYLIGTGQYVFKEWVSGDHVTLVKNQNYWDPANAGNAQTIIFRPILEGSSRTIALQNGEIDVAIDPPLTELDILSKDPNIIIHEQPGTRMFYFAFNTSKAPWNNKLLRQAVATAINKQDVITVAVNGKGTPQTTLLNRGLWGFYDDMPGYPFNVDNAKQLMSQAGYPNGGIATTLLIANTDPYSNIATVIQSELKAIGIDVTIKVVDSATLKQACVDGTQDLFLWRWNEDQKDDWVYGDLYRSDSPYNYDHYVNPAADALILKVRTEKDQTQRMADGITLQKLLVDDSPTVPLYLANLVIAYNKNLQGDYFFGGGNHDWSHAYIAIP